MVANRRTKGIGGEYRMNSITNFGVVQQSALPYVLETVPDTLGSKLHTLAEMEALGYVMATVVEE